MYLRIFSPNTTIVGADGANTILKKKGNVEITTWSVSDSEIGTINFRKVKTIEIRKIPENMRGQDIEGKTVMLNTISGKSIIFQPLSDICFLTMSDSGKIERIRAVDISVDDNVLVYDQDMEDFCVEDVKDFHVSQMVDQVLGDDPDDVTDDEEKEPKNIGDYIVNTSGNSVIINDFFLCGA